jgi:RHS repeat-associated protein
LSYGNTTEWKLYGPDINGVYGGANGTGGFEAVSPYLTLFEPTISDVRGNILGVVTNGAIQWNPARPTGYGAVPGYRPVALGNGTGVSLSSAWRGRWADSTSYIQVGARTYDPVSGHWLSFDPAWNGLDPNGFSAFGGDPINFFDRDGRVSQNLYADQATHNQIANSFQDYVEEESWNTPGMNGPAQPGSLAYLMDYVNYFGWPADSSQELQYVGGHSSRGGVGPRMKASQ